MVRFVIPPAGTPAFAAWLAKALSAPKVALPKREPVPKPERVVRHRRPVPVPNYFDAALAVTRGGPLPDLDEWLAHTHADPIATARRQARDALLFDQAAHDNLHNPRG